MLDFEVGIDKLDWIWFSDEECAMISYEQMHVVKDLTTIINAPLCSTG
jgi:hypothetical protein